jgi:hypothetical protein
MIRGDPPASTETSLERLARAIRALFESAIGGPASSTDNAVVRYDGADGRSAQDSTVTIDDTGNIALATSTQIYLSSESSPPAIGFKNATPVGVGATITFAANNAMIYIRDNTNAGAMFGFVEGSGATRIIDQTSAAHFVTADPGAGTGKIWVRTDGATVSITNRTVAQVSLAIGFWGQNSHW